MDEKILQDRQRGYARVIVKRGVNLKPGQNLVINADLSAAEFARLVVQEAYDAGARDVAVQFADEKSGEIRLRETATDVLTDIPPYRADSVNFYANADSCWIRLETVSPPPEGLDPEKIAAFSKAWRSAINAMREAQMTNLTRWNISAVPTPSWAAMVYPDLDPSEGLNRLWEDVLEICRCASGDPELNWDEQIRRNTNYKNILNDHQFTELHFQNGLGTDLHVGMVENYRFEATQSVGDAGIPFLPNIPSEEIFAAPHKDRVNGTVVSTKPLYYNNMLVEGLRFTFKDGKVIDFDADKNKEIIGKLLEVDEGSTHLGEVALVPFDSAISNTGLIFYTTLFDENASCHLALGDSYPDTIENGLSMTKEELAECGMNSSLEHVDFMFGSEDMTITGITKDGKEVPVFREGNWAL